MIYRLAYPALHNNLPFPAVVSEPLNAIYHYAHLIFCLMFTATQYVVVRMSIFERKWFWFRHAIKWKNLIVPSQNIASLKVLPTCLSILMHPLPKMNYLHLGIREDLRIVHDIIYRPASGLCLGMSLTFLSSFLSKNEGDALVNLKYAASLLKNGGTETSVEVQALYDALLGLEGKINEREKNECRGLFLENKKLPEADPKNRLYEIIKLYMQETDRPTLRHFVFKHMESHSMDITSDLYALTLELDTLWSHFCHPRINKNTPLHHATIRTVAHKLEMEVVDSCLLHGKIPSILEHLKEMSKGPYLIHFANHAIALVKTQNHTALFVPNEGLALFDEDRQEEGFTDLLNYFGDEGRATCEVISLQRCTEKQ